VPTYAEVVISGPEPIETSDEAIERSLAKFPASVTPLDVVAKLCRFGAIDAWREASSETSPDSPAWLVGMRGEGLTAASVMFEGWENDGVNPFPTTPVDGAFYIWDANGGWQAGHGVLSGERTYESLLHVPTASIPITKATDSPPYPTSPPPAFDLITRGGLLSATPAPCPGGTLCDEVHAVLAAIRELNMEISADRPVTITNAVARLLPHSSALAWRGGSFVDPSDPAGRDAVWVVAVATEGMRLSDYALPANRPSDPEVAGMWFILSASGGGLGSMGGLAPEGQPGLTFSSVEALPSEALAIGTPEPLPTVTPGPSPTSPIDVTD